MEDENLSLMEKPKAEEDIPGKMEQPPLKSGKSQFHNSYIAESSISQIEELLGEGQLANMLKRLQEDIQGSSKEVLMANFKETFGL